MTNSEPYVTCTNCNCMVHVPEIERLKALAYHKNGTTYQSMFICTLDAMDENERLKRQVAVLRDGISAVQVLPYHQVWPTLREALAAADKIAKGE